jgi:hypothetical protein
VPLYPGISLSVRTLLGHEPLLFEPVNLSGREPLAFGVAAVRSGADAAMPRKVSCRTTFRALADTGFGADVKTKKYT